jgi:hypothetical protein
LKPEKFKKMKKVLVFSILILSFAEARLSAQISAAIITGSFNVGTTLTASTSGSPESGNYVTYEWYYSSPVTLLGSSGTYLILSADQAKSIYLKAIEKKTSDNSEVRSFSTSPAIVNSFPVASNVNVIGNPKSGLTVYGYYTYSDADGNGQNVSTFKWYTATDNAGADITAIGGAGTTSYKITDAENALYIAFSVTPSAVAGSTPGAEAISGWVGPVSNTKPVVTNVTISGLTKVGSVLTASYQYSDDEGDLEGASEYQWMRSDNSDGSSPADINLATSISYKLTNDDFEKYIGFSVIPVAQTGQTHGNKVTVPAVTWLGQVTNDPPVATIHVISKTSLNVGGILTGQYTYSDAEGDVESGSTFQWYSSLTSGGTYSAISSETSLNHIIKMDEQGRYFKIYVTPKAATGTKDGLEVQSLFVGPANSKPIASSVTIAGTVVVDNTLTGNYSYQDPDSDPQNIPAAIFRWLRNGTEIPGASAKTYKIVEDDEGKKLRFEVTPVSLTGFPDMGDPVTSAETITVPASSTLPVASQLCIDGIRKTGEIITGKYTFSGTSNDDKFKFRWMRGTDTIPGETGETLTLSSLDINQDIFFVVYPYSHSLQNRGTTVKSPSLARINLVKDTFFNSDRDTILTGVPSGGVFYGDGITGDKFSPSSLDYTLSPFTINYQKIITMSHVSCQQLHPKQITVNGVNMYFDSFESKYCQNGKLDTIYVKNLPSGFTPYSFLTTGLNAVVYQKQDTVVIDPSLLTAGDIDYLVFYAFNPLVGYIYIYKIFPVDAVPPVSIIGLPANSVFCNNNPEFKLLGSPTGGVFSGPAIKSPDIFDASLGRRNDTVIYKITTPRGCISSDIVPLIINPSPVVSFAAADSCIINEKDSTRFLNYTVSIDSVETWNWNFSEAGGSFNDPNESPSYLFKTGGLHKVTLTAKTTESCNSTIEKNIDLGFKPKADFYWKNECFHTGSGDMLQLYDTTISQSVIASRTWIFPDRIRNRGPLEDTLNYPKSNKGYLPVSYIVRTNYRNCHDTVNVNLYIRPTVSLTAADYVQDFANGKGGWVKDYESQNSWTFGISDRTKIKSTPGDSAWFTRYTLSTPGNPQVVETSSIISPCFDFTAVERPMINLKLWKRFDYNRDGAVLQYKIGDEKQWQYVGTLEDGINWFNSPLIKGSPGGGQVGWTSFINKQDADWSESKHYLDELRNKTDVKFRLAYGTDGSSQDNDGIAIDSLSIGRRTRGVLLEHFTNTASLAGSQTTEIVSDLSDTRKTDVINIQYHTNFPGSDIYYNDNPGDASARLIFYGLSKVPYTLIDGGTKIDYAKLIDYNLIPAIDSNDLSRRSLIEPIFDITLNPSTVSNNILTVGGQIRAVKDLTLTNATLFIAVTQKVSNQATGAQGETVFHNVFRKFIPDAGGINLNKTWVKNTPFIITDKQWTISKIPNNAKIEVIAFIQNNITKEIYQAVSDTLSITVGIDKIEALKGAGFLLYPNPTVNQLTVEFEKELLSETEIMICDFKGTITRTYKAGSGQTELTIADLGLRSGIYLVRIKSAGIEWGFKKLIITDN